MVVSKREKYIGFSAGAAVLLLLLNNFVLDPYTEAMSQIQIDTDKANTQIANNKKVEDIKTSTADPRWKIMMAQGISSDEAQAESNLQHSLLTWTAAAGVQTQDLHADASRNDGVFSIIGYRVTVNASTATLAKLLWSIETTNSIPVRISEIQINPQPEGSDNLQAHLEVTTLCQPDTSGPGAKAPANLEDLEGEFQ
ncbi:MAG TPA: GspMb/PilO family protein [Tepidisphaeraceae bacterium]|nr:GspMb/PilO family protein [Tepidisphaeraceae bacterium]